MARVFFHGVCLFMVLGSSAVATAQDAWPTYPLDGHNITRGPGGYLSPVKLLLLWLLFLLWVKTTDWVNRDAQLLKLNHLLWNPIVFLSFLVTFLLITLNVAFPIGYSALVVSWMAPLGVYIYLRNANVEQHDKVLTPDHFRFLAAAAGKKMGMKIEVEKKAAHERGAPVKFKATAARNENKNQANMILARQSDGFVPTKDMIADACERRGEKVMMDFEGDGVMIRYQIDGVWHEADPLDRETGDMILEVLKRIIDAEVEERRKRQAGECAITYKDEKFTGNLVTQGTKTGERAILHLLKAGLAFPSLTEAGMRGKMQDSLKEVLAQQNGLFIFTAVPGGGLSTTMALTEKMCDRYMRDFISFQEAGKPEPVADNIEIETYEPGQGVLKETLESLFRKDPDVVVVHELVDKDVAELACERASDNKMILTSIRAKEAVEALLRVLLLKVPAKTFAPSVIGVLNQRLIRKLCEECKEEYAPSPEQMKKLGIPAGRVESLYRPPEPDDDQPVCTQCSGLGYHGRTSIFELLIVDDSIREALIKQPKLEVLRKVARKAGNRTLREEGIALVAQGITSVPELNRVLKQP